MTKKLTRLSPALKRKIFNKSFSEVFNDLGGSDHLFREEILKKRESISNDIKSSRGKYTLSPREKYYKSIQDEILSKTNLFSKHLPGNKKFKKMSVYFDKYSAKMTIEEIVNIFIFANKVFYIPGAIFTPLHTYNKKISICEFFSFTKETINKPFHLPDKNGKQTKIKSLFNEFSKGEEYIKKNFFRPLKNTLPNETTIFIHQFKKHMRRDSLSNFEINCFVKFARKVNEFCLQYEILNEYDLKKPDWQLIHHVLENQFWMKGKKIEAHFINSNGFWSQIRNMLIQHNPQRFQEKIERKDTIERLEQERQNLGMTKEEFTKFKISKGEL